MARAMLRRYPNVHRYVETGDVLQNALLRLLRALQKIDPASMREFFGLAAMQIRRELLDLARHFKDRMPLLEQDLAKERRSEESDFEVGDEASAEADLSCWCSFHEAVERLPAAEREVFSLSFYHGWTQEQIAELLQVSDRQVRRRWKSALLALSAELGERLPDVLEADGHKTSPS